MAVPFQTVGLIGLGLIGGSLARSIRAHYPDTQICAYDTDLNNLTQALAQGVINTACTEADAAFASCSLVILCAPVQANESYLPALKNICSPDCLISDVGSVKSGIHKAVKALGLERQFIGGHPMAGSEKSGYASSSDHLLENAYYILTACEETPGERLAAFSSYVQSLGAIPLLCSCAEHDHIVAAVSHLPHLIAASLVDLVRAQDSPDEKMKMIAAGGFEDITRLASSSPVMWEQICMLNEQPIEEMLDAYIQSLCRIKSQLCSHSSGAIRQLFETSRDYRDSLPSSASGPLARVYAIYCDIIDEAGGIAIIATILASKNISIKNIGIIHNRSFEEGVLRIEFYEEDACRLAASLLKKYRYTVYEI